jgi:gliding-associated putative ABC transporter substrate-binding component GldG
MGIFTADNLKPVTRKSQAIVQLLILAAVLVLINIVAYRFHVKADLTSEKRYTLSPSSKKLLKGLDDVVTVKVYLKGKFPAGFQKLAGSTRELLQNFRDVAGAKVQFEFINPFEGKTEAERAEVYKQFAEKGMMPTQLAVQQSEDQSYSETIIYPTALVMLNGKEMPVNLLETRLGMGAQQQLNVSERLLEFKLINAIHKLQQPDKYNVAYITGNGESLGNHTIDLLTTLAMGYNLDTLDLNNITSIPISYKAIIIAKPTVTFDDKAKFKLDQYIMHGGKALFLIDQLRCDADSLRTIQQFVTTDYNLNLDDLLFQYGIRVNPVLVEDLQCNPIPLIVGQQQGANKMEAFPWIYYPVLVPDSRHPIVNNMDAVQSFYANTIDTIQNADITKTVLLHTSQYSRSIANPARVTLAMLQFKPNPDLFNKPFKPVAVLAEGKFRSIYSGRVTPAFLQVLRDSLKQDYVGERDSGKIIVVADGDIVANDFTEREGPMPLGYYRGTKETFANKDFILNCLEYLTDDSGLLETRSKDIRLRLLDQNRIKNEKLRWQLLNIVFPALLVIFFGSLYLFIRRKKYGQA